MEGARKPPMSRMTRWWLFWAEGCGRPPTSCEDSLVVVLGEVECRGKWKATNESKRLVGGLFGRG